MTAASPTRWIASHDKVRSQIAARGAGLSQDPYIDVFLGGVSTHCVIMSSRLAEQVVILDD